jgi:hypothetical protein
MLLLFGSCHQKDHNHENMAIRYQSYPFYKDYIALDTKHIGASLTKLNNKYPRFLDFYLDTVMSLNIHGHYSDTNKVFNSLLTFKDYHHLFDTVLKVFPDTKEQDKEIETAFKNLKFADSNGFRIPTKVYYFISYLTNSAFTSSDTILGIGLDMYLGRNFKPYESVGIPAYATVRFTKENIPVWACRVVYENRFPFNPDNKNLLNLMIEKGKEIYFLKKCLPEIPERLLLGFTEEQMNWCDKNNALIYNFLIQNKLLYETRLQEIMRYVLDGPNTPGFAPESPGNLGTYIGWKIVTDYAENKKLDLESLLRQQNAQLILREANYKP